MTERVPLAVELRELNPKDPWHHRYEVIAGPTPKNDRGKCTRAQLVALGSTIALALLGCALLSQQRPTTPPSKRIVERGAYSAEPLPFSTKDPVEDLGMKPFERVMNRPGEVWQNIKTTKQALPTNAWYMNLVLGSSIHGIENRAFVIPNVVDTGGPIPGLRTHATTVAAAKSTVEQAWVPEHGLTLGAMEATSHKHTVPGPMGPKKFGIDLQWSAANTVAGGSMVTPIVRGSPYTTMIYRDMTPVLVAETGGMEEMPMIDGDRSNTMACGQLNASLEFNITSATQLPPFPSFLVEKEVSVTFSDSDQTWLIFVSEPTYFRCGYRPTQPIPAAELSDPKYKAPPYKLPFFRLEATGPIVNGGMRIAMSNNCTNGRSITGCAIEGSKDTTLKKRDALNYTQLLRTHAAVYPSTEAEALFAFPAAEIVRDPVTQEIVDRDENISLQFDFCARWFYPRNKIYDDDRLPEGTGSFGTSARPIGEVTSHSELLMMALPHHVDRIYGSPESSNHVQDVGCTPTIHGNACPVVGSIWAMGEHLSDVSFWAEVKYRDELRDDLIAALNKDLLFDVDENYKRGAGDTYFSGKMIAKLARIILIGHEAGADFLQLRNNAIDRLREDVTVWLNGNAQNPFVYDQAWGGLASCGCIYDNVTRNCTNSFPDCPAEEDMGNNFGFSFYNDHHFHLGYHIYGAAVLAYFDHTWFHEYYEHVMLLVRDIVNPSRLDPHFTTFRNKDWYLGSSWASGVVTNAEGQPYPNGRNEESSAEAIAAYEAVALLGQAGMTAFLDVPDDSVTKDFAEKRDTLQRVYDMGRLLMATEIRSAQRYWHVRAAPAPRVYPSAYKAKVVGMLWSTLAQEQTWFGPEKWKAYGIQLLPFTPAAGLRDEPDWIAEMLPVFNHSCSADPVCAADGWSILIYMSLATMGDWQSAHDHIMKLPDEVFTGPGGNGHSRTNSLWWIATRYSKVSPKAPTVAEVISYTGTLALVAFITTMSVIFIRKRCVASSETSP